MRSFHLLYLLPAACAALLLASLSASAASASKPLVLDTESGINDGGRGVVLQTAPLSQQPIVTATPARSPAELPPDSSPIIVAPYINLPMGGASAPRPGYRPRSSQ